MMEIKIDDKWCKADKEVSERMGEYYRSMVEAHKMYDELKAAVLKVRDLQKKYFKTKAFNILEESKAAERELDDILSGKSNSKQAALF